MKTKNNTRVFCVRFGAALWCVIDATYPFHPIFFDTIFSRTTWSFSSKTDLFCTQLPSAKDFSHHFFLNTFLSRYKRRETAFEWFSQTLKGLHWKRFTTASTLILYTSSKSKSEISCVFLIFSLELFPACWIFASMPSTFLFMPLEPKS